MITRLSLAALVALTIVSPTMAESEALHTLEAWCVGGVAGIYEYVSVTADGEIRATNGFADRPWPVVGDDIAAASSWFAALALSGPADLVEPDDDAPVVTDAINCGLSVSGDGKVVQYDHPEVHQEIMVWLPER